VCVCAFQVLVRSLTAPGNGASAKEAAAWALATLAVHAPSRQPIIAAGALPALHRLAKDPVRATREAAIVAHEMLSGRGGGGLVRPPLLSTATTTVAVKPASSVGNGAVARQLFAEEAAAAAVNDAPQVCTALFSSHTESTARHTHART
jgi:hypothetical protein